MIKFSLGKRRGRIGFYTIPSIFKEKGVVRKTTPLSMLKTNTDQGI